MVIGANNSNAVSILADGSFVQQISSTMGKFVDAFSGASYAAGAESIAALTGPAGNWDIVRNSGGATITLNNGSLVLGLGTAAGNEVMLVARSNCSIPQNLIASLMISQRLNANEIRVGYVQVDETGAPVANPNLPNFFMNSASIMFGGTTNTWMSPESMEDGQPTMKSSTNNGQSATTILQDYSIECRPEDITYSSQVADSAVVRSATATRYSSVVPNSGVLYRPFIWVRNISAAASNTNVTINRVVSMDIQELQAEIGGGRGNIAPSQAVPVYPVAGSSTAVTGAVTINNSTMIASTNLGLTHKLISAAGTNATSVKGSIGRIYGGTVTNLAGTVRYLKLYAKTTPPMVGTDTPSFTLPLLPGAHLSLAMIAGPLHGLALAGIAYALTTGADDADTGAVGAGEVLVNLVYY